MGIKVVRIATETIPITMTMMVIQNICRSANGNKNDLVSIVTIMINIIIVVVLVPVLVLVIILA